MSVFVESPNLPENTEIILIGQKYKQLLNDSLLFLGIFPKYVPNNPNIDPRLSGHADLSALHGGGERVYLASYLRDSALADELSALGAELVFPDMEQKQAYPGDAQLNVCSVGRTLFGNFHSCPQEIAEYFTSKGDRLIHCRQGYARCSMCVVSDRAVVSSDAGLHRAAINAGLDALLIEPGYIVLDGFTHGFIGGASFKISRSKLAFTGRLSGHPSERRILDFLAAHEVEPVYLTELPAFDVGAAIPLTEKRPL